MSPILTRFALVAGLLAIFPVVACKRDRTPSKAVYNPPAGSTSEPKQKKHKKRDKAAAQAEGFKNAKAKKAASGTKSHATPTATPEKKSE
jgi:hypothetical protein